MITDPANPLYGCKDPAIARAILSGQAPWHNMKDDVINWAIFFFPFVAQFILNRTGVRMLKAAQADPVSFVKANGGLATLLAARAKNTGDALSADYLEKHLKEVAESDGAPHHRRCA